MRSAFALPGELTVYTAGEVRTLFLNWSSDGRDSGDAVLTVDAAAVVEVDGAGVQLLASLSRTLQARQRRLLLRSPSRALASACTTLGLADLLDEGMTT